MHIQKLISESTYPPETIDIEQLFNTICNTTSFLFFRGRAFLVFSFLFGLSFFLQIDRASQRGVDFRLRFLWRLFLLFIIGLFHTCFYTHDILTTFAITGCLLIPLYKVKTRYIVCLIIICLLSPVAVYNALISGHFIDATPSSQWALVEFFRSNLNDNYQLYLSGSFTDVATYNLYPQSISAFLFLFTGGRLWLTLALFMLGLLAGRYRIFENIKEHLVFFRNTLIGGIIISGIIICLYKTYPACEVFVKSWGTLAFSLAFISAIVLIYQYIYIPAIITSHLAAVGKCTLTCYVTQSLIFVPIFYGWGLGLATSTPTWVCAMMSIGVFVLQSVCAKIWLKYFQYGPLEYLWRSGTMMSWQKLRRNP